ncbi:14630_t:CDS:1, partial [Cetraspora pellucida]
MRISCELNNKDFIITVLPDDNNPLKSDFQCTCETTTTEIKPNPSIAINTCYQEIFKTKQHTL